MEMEGWRFSLSPTQQWRRGNGALACQLQDVMPPYAWENKWPCLGALIHTATAPDVKAMSNKEGQQVTNQLLTRTWVISFC